MMLLQTPVVLKSLGTPRLKLHGALQWKTCIEDNLMIHRGSALVELGQVGAAQQIQGQPTPPDTQFQTKQ